jgi:DNA-binding response OmpR family regulator
MKRILIIEDDQIVGTIYRRKLQLEGFEVALAADGEAGLAAVFSFRPDLVILDLMLPRLNGVEVLRRLRAHPEYQKLPVIVLSNAYLSNLVQDATNAGANQCLIKANCTPKQILEVIRGTLAREHSATRPAPGPTPTPDTPASSPPAPATSTRPAPDDTTYQLGLRQAFLADGLETLAQLRTMLQDLVKSEGDAARLPNLFTLYRRVHSVTSNAAVAGLTSISRLCAALEALLKELYEKPKNINASTIRTIAQTIDFLATLFDHSRSTSTDVYAPPRILVVDDEAISRRALIYALEKANLRCNSLEDPLEALALLSDQHYDLILLDVDMPGLNGFELCTRLRAQPTNAHSPVIFVTSLADFENRARSTLSGGNDLIAKPFLFMELALKAITHILRGQVTTPRA